MTYKKSKKPYLLYIDKIKNNNDLILQNQNYKNKNYKNNNIKLSPMSGSETPYNPNKWNKNPSIRKSHNCYAYAMGKIIKGLRHKPQPGYASGYGQINDKDYTCENFRNRLKKDSPGTYLEKFDNACLPGFYKIFLALDPMNDYHWWKQDSNGYWSHKPGASKVVNVDASGKKIKNPLLSDRKFKHRNYHKPCFFACIYSDLTRSLDNIYK